MVDGVDVAGAGQFRDRDAGAEELGLLSAPARISGQRRYSESAARLVAAILLFSAAGFTLAEQKALLARLAGQPLSRSHQQLHGQRFREMADSC